MLDFNIKQRASYNIAEDSTAKLSLLFLHRRNILYLSALMYCERLAVPAGG